MLSSSGSRSGTDVRNGAIVVKIVRARFENEPSTVCFILTGAGFV